MFFGKRKFLDPDVEEWHIDCWRYLLRNFGGVERVKSAPLALPTATYFPQVAGAPHERAEAVFLRIKTLMGMADWPCTLVERYPNNAEVAPFAFVRSEKPVGGTFQSEDGRVIITYDPGLVAYPYNLIAMFAHELAHYRLHSVEELPPGADVEPMIEELATEMAVAFFGFGLIAANGAFSFEQFQDFGRQGWRGGPSGYFSEDGWVFALAVFLSLREEAADAAKKHLKEHLAKRLDVALKHLAQNPAIMAAVRAP
ncbi:hypothetical protein [Terricaulis sp.]|uniref:hypothetical protein n=1 Tax=Terricaulis sp. TaxID=2768686 RepID=UPI003782F404